MSKNENIRILRQDNERGIVVMNSPKYRRKCLNILSNEQFIKIYDDTTKRIEGKIQRCVQKLKNKVSKDEYSIIGTTSYHLSKHLTKSGKIRKNSLKNLKTSVHLRIRNWYHLTFHYFSQM